MSGLAFLGLVFTGFALALLALRWLHVQQRDEAPAKLMRRSATQRVCIRPWPRRLPGPPPNPPQERP